MARLVAIAGILVISFSAILVKAAAVSPGTSAFFRAAYAVPVLAVLAWRVRATDPRPASARWTAFAAGAFLAIDLNLWHRSIEYVGAGLATVLANLQVVLVPLVAWVAYRERPPLVAALGVPTALVGVALTTGLGRGDAYGSNPTLGAVLGVLTAVAYTGFLVLLRRANQGLSPPAGPLFDAIAGTAVVGFVLGVAFDPSFDLTPSGWSLVWLLVLAIGAQTGGWLAITYAMPRLPSLDTSILLLVQPCLTVVWGVILFTEAPSATQLAGVVLVLGSVASVSWASAQRQAVTDDASP